MNLSNYLNEFTVIKLKFMCEWFDISKYGTKDKIIQKIKKNNITQSQIKNLINLSLGKKYLHFCLGSDKNGDRSDNKHKFFSNNKIVNRLEFCSECKKKCYTFTSINPFYNINEAVEEEFNKHSKEKIPATIRNSVWNKYIGVNDKKGLCFCCCSEDISFANFHCGHIIPEKKGGLITIDNLRPICGHCNSSIGSKNMLDFMEKYGLEKHVDWNGINLNNDVKLNTNNSNGNDSEFKTAVWIKYLARNKKRECFVGCGSELNQQNYYYGYLYLNDDNNIDNARPVCNMCIPYVKKYGIIKFRKMYDLDNEEVEVNTENNLDKQHNNRTEINKEYKIDCIIELDSWWGLESVYVKEGSILHNIKMKFIDELIKHKILTNDELEYRNRICYLKLLDKSKKHIDDNLKRSVYNKVNNSRICINDSSLIIGRNTILIQLNNTLNLTILYKSDVGNNALVIRNIFLNILCNLTKEINILN